MPSKDSHLQRADSNEQFSRNLLMGSSHLDWAVVSLFYSALHLVDAYLALDGRHPNGHTTRRKSISSDLAIKRIGLPYRELRQRCDDARYDLLPVSDTLVNSLLMNEYTTIRGHIGPLL